MSTSRNRYDNSEDDLSTPGTGISPLAIEKIIELLPAMETELIRIADKYYPLILAPRFKERIFLLALERLSIALSPADPATLPIEQTLDSVISGSDPTSKSELNPEPELLELFISADIYDQSKSQSPKAETIFLEHQPEHQPEINSEVSPPRIAEYSFDSFHLLESLKNAGIVLDDKTVSALLEHISPESNLYCQLLGELDSQLENLIVRSVNPEEIGAESRRLLSYVITHSGRPLIQARREIASIKLAESLLELSGLEPLIRNEIKDVVKVALTGAYALHADARRSCLAALDRLHEPDKYGNRAISQSEYSNTIFRALYNELADLSDLSDQGNNKLKILLLERLARIGHPQLFVILEAVSSANIGSELILRAKEIDRAMRSSVLERWKQAPLDFVADSNRRAERLQTALSSYTSSRFPVISDSEALNHIIDTIFINSKGAVLEPEDVNIENNDTSEEIHDSSDPLNEILISLLDHEQEALRLAAAVSLSQSPVKGSRDNNYLRHALRVLSHLALNSEDATIMNDSAQWLSELSTANTVMTELVENSNREASLLYLERHHH